MKNKIYIARLQYLDKGIDLSDYLDIKSIRIIDPKHNESMMISADEYLYCKEKDLICILIN